MSICVTIPDTTDNWAHYLYIPLTGLSTARKWKFYKPLLSIFLHYLSFPNIEMVQVIEHFLHGRQGPAYHTQLITWLLMTWQYKEPGHLQQWHCLIYSGIFQFQHWKGQYNRHNYHIQHPDLKGYCSLLIKSKQNISSNLLRSVFNRCIFRGKKCPWVETWQREVACQKFISASINDKNQ